MSGRGGRKDEGGAADQLSDRGERKDEGEGRRIGLAWLKSDSYRRPPPAVADDAG